VVGQDTRTLLEWGLLEMRSKNFEEAEAKFLDGLKIEEKNSAIWCNYARLMVEKNRDDKAREVLNKGLALRPR